MLLASAPYVAEWPHCFFVRAPLHSGGGCQAITTRPMSRVAVVLAGSTCPVIVPITNFMPRHYVIKALRHSGDRHPKSFPHSTAQPAGNTRTADIPSVNSRSPAGSDKACARRDFFAGPPRLPCVRSDIKGEANPYEKSSRSTVPGQAEHHPGRQVGASLDVGEVREPVRVFPPILRDSGLWRPLRYGGPQPHWTIPCAIS